MCAFPYDSRYCHELIPSVLFVCGCFLYLFSSAFHSIFLSAFLSFSPFPSLFLSTLISFYFFLLQFRLNDILILFSINKICSLYFLYNPFISCIFFLFLFPLYLYIYRSTSVYCYFFLRPSRISFIHFFTFSLSHSFFPFLSSFFSLFSFYIILFFHY